MSWRFYLLFGLLGLLPLALAAYFEASPGYMDADYYYAGGLRLAEGKGFSEEILWNYLDDPAGLPHPSHAYWMPLVSILAAAGMALTRQAQFTSARLPFILIAAAIPPISGALAWRLSRSKREAALAAALACLPAFYLPFLPATDGFGVSMLLGGAFFLVMPGAETAALSLRSILVKSFSLGVLAGLMHLGRADGALWVLIALLATASMCLDERNRADKYHRAYRLAAGACLLCLAGYGAVIAPWLLRNQDAFGSWLTPGGWHALWITSYDELFSYPATLLTPARWWGSGLAAILGARLWAASQNLQSALAVQGLIFLALLALAGFWHFRKDRRAQLAALAWLAIFLLMTIIFPFQGARGGFFHSGAALQPFIWAVTPAGLEAMLEWGRQKRGWRIDQARPVFSSGLIGLALVLCVVILYGRFKPGKLARTTWDDPHERYTRLEQALQKRNPIGNDIVMVNNAPGYYIASQRPAISIPYGDLATVCSVAERYKARYLIMEIDQIQGANGLFEHPADRQCLHYVDTTSGAKVFEIMGQ